MRHLVDIGVNLCDKSFASDLAEVIARAQGVGVSQMVVTGTTIEQSHNARRLCQEFPDSLWSTAGIHPHYTKTFADDSLESLRTLAGHPEVVAIGETGLDFHRNLSSPDEQERSFQAHILLAKELDLPLFLHERDASERMLEILQREAPLPPAVIHCFTGSEEALGRYLHLGLSIGITGWICDERRGLKLRELVPRIPRDKLMLETDAPYLLPRTLSPKPKSRRNLPQYLPEVLRVVAESIGISQEELALTSTQNARSFFRLPAPP